MNFAAVQQRGVALAMVLWFLAAMSFIVSGIVYEARADIKLAQAHSARAKAAASGDGAIQLTLVALLSNKGEGLEGQHIIRSRHVVGQQVVEVELVPVSGLINIGSASRKVLQALFEVRADLNSADAQQLADNVTRKKGDFQAPEDFLQVEGASRAILDSIRDVIYAGPVNSGRLDLKAAPDAVLQVVKKDDPQGVAALAQQGQAGGKASKSQDYRVDASVTVGDRTWLRRRWVSLENASEGDLPWTITRTEAPRVPAAEQIQ
jgi:general secretion pathway protein K